MRAAWSGRGCGYKRTQLVRSAAPSTKVLRQSSRFGTFGTFGKFGKFGMLAKCAALDSLSAQYPAFQSVHVYG